MNLKYNPLLKIEFFLACKRGWYRDHGAESKNRRRKRKRKKKEKKEGCGAARAKVSSARSYGKHVTIERNRLLVKDTSKIYFLSWSKVTCNP